MAIFISFVTITLFLYLKDTNGITLSHQDLPEFIGLMNRDVEAVPGPLAFGHKYMTGGAGEGSQRLRPESDFEEREQVKSDNILPAYCEPPNPCPLGYTSADGCLEEFENSAEFSRNYQASQICICDQEHMFNCPDKRADEIEESLQSILSDQGLHKTLIAKKFHEKRSQIREPRRKRSVTKMHGRYSYNQNPYFKGEILKTVTKKDGRNTWL